jgi:hypothetical protein
MALSTSVAWASVAPRPAPAPGDEVEIRALLVRYEEAIESQDIERFRTVKPNLSDDERERLERSFRSIQSHAVELTIVSLETDPPHGRVVVQRRDILNAGTAADVATAFSQVLELSRAGDEWHIESIRR